MAKEKNEVAVVQEFNLISAKAGLDEETKAMLDDEMDDLDHDGGIFCRRIKLPTGSSKAFEVEGDDPNDPEILKELDGVVLFTHKMNTRWDGDFGGESRVPACSSFDAKTGVDFETGEAISCDRCPYNRFREDGAGKDCKNMRRIYMMLNGQQWLYLLTVPPTSLKSVNTQLQRIMAEGLPFTKTVIRFSLEAATSRTGKDFSRIVLKKVGVLTDEKAKLSYAMRQEIKEQYKTVGIDNDDYSVPEDAGYQDAAPQGPVPEPGPEGFTRVPDGIDDELPFN